MTSDLLLPQRPLVPVALAFAMGVLVQQFGWALVLLVLPLFVGGLYARWWTGRQAVWLVGFAFVGGLRALGGTGASADDVSHFISPAYVTLRGYVASDAERRIGAWTCEIAVEQVTLPDGRTVRTTGHAATLLATPTGGVPLEYGEAIEARGLLEAPAAATNPGGYDRAAYLARRQIHTEFTCRLAGAWHLLPVQDNLGNPFLRLAVRCRHSAQQAFLHLLPPAEASLLSGILLGTRSSLPPALNEDFAVTGTAHILATAGLHVGMIALLFAGVCRLLGRSRQQTAVVMMLALLLYALVAGGRPPIWRAVVMAEVYLTGYLLDREADGLNSMAAAALVLLFLHPLALFEVGFQLSFVTVFVIFLLLRAVEPFLSALRQTERQAASAWDRGWRRGWLFCFDLVLLSAAAQLGSAPLVAEYFNTFSPVGILANVLIVPALYLLISGGGAAWIFLFFWPTMAYGVAQGLLSPVLAYLIGAAQFSANLPGAVVSVASPGWMFITLYYLAVVMGCHLLRQRLAGRPALRQIEEGGITASNETAQA